MGGEGSRLREADCIVEAMSITGSDIVDEVIGVTVDEIPCLLYSL